MYQTTLQFLFLVGSVSAVQSVIDFDDVTNKDHAFGAVDEHDKFKDEEVLMESGQYRNDPWNRGFLTRTLARGIVRHTAPISCKNSVMKKCRRTCAFGRCRNSCYYHKAKVCSY